MNAVDMLKYNHGLTNMVLRAYLSDLNDADLMQRPENGCNHIAWQLGHLVKSNVHLLSLVGAAEVPTLPDGFADQYSTETAGNDDPAAFLTKDEYLAYCDQVDEAFLKAIETATPEDFSKPSPESFQAYAPTIGGIYCLIATHAMMHVGQWVPVRRRLGKPVMI